MKTAFFNKYDIQKHYWNYGPPIKQHGNLWVWVQVLIFKLACTSMYLTKNTHKKPPVFKFLFFLKCYNETENLDSNLNNNNWQLNSWLCCTNQG